jgi:hypothetical protein
VKIPPVVIIAVGIGLVLLVLSGSAQAAAPESVKVECDPKALEKGIVEGSVQGGATGAVAGPKGAAVGAVIGGGLSVMEGCSRAQFNKAKKAVCAKANKILGRLNAKPPGWSSWSCDQRLAYVIASGPYVQMAVLAGNVAISAVGATKAEIARFASNAESAAKKAGAKIGSDAGAGTVGNAIKKAFGF